MCVIKSWATSLQDMAHGLNSINMIQTTIQLSVPQSDYHLGICDIPTELVNVYRGVASSSQLVRPNLTLSTM